MDVPQQPTIDEKKVEEHVEDTNKEEQQWAMDAADLAAWRKAQEMNWAAILSSLAYRAYTSVFYCSRRVMKALFHDETVERQKLILEIPAPKYPWMCILATVGGEEYDVTDVVNGAVEPGQRVTPEWLFETVDVPDVTDGSTVTWEYVDSVTFEVHKITSDGLVNEIKSKTD